MFKRYPLQMIVRDDHKVRLVRRETGTKTDSVDAEPTTRPSSNP